MLPYKLQSWVHVKSISFKSLGTSLPFGNSGHPTVNLVQIPKEAIATEEADYDLLEVNGISFSGQIGPENVVPGGLILWDSAACMQVNGQFEAQGGSILGPLTL